MNGNIVLGEHPGTAGSALGSWRLYVPGLGIDDRVAMVDMAGSTATGVHYYATNRLGSVIGMVDSAGVLTDQYLYSPFGVEEPLSASGNPFRYTGRYYDGETGLYYYRSRYYDTGGRFLEPDSIGYKGGLNLYSYGGGDPINNVDPLGTEERAFSAPETSLSHKLAIFAKTFAKTAAESLEFSNGRVSLEVDTSALDTSVQNGGDAQAKAAGIIAGVGIGLVGSRGRSATKLFRVVDAKELADIKATGAFKLVDGKEVKQFVGNLPSAKKLQKAFQNFFGGKQTIVSATAPKSLVESADKIKFSDIPNGEAITLRAEELEKVIPD